MNVTYQHWLRETDVRNLPAGLLAQRLRMLAGYAPTDALARLYEAVAGAVEVPPVGREVAQRVRQLARHSVDADEGRFFSSLEDRLEGLVAGGAEAAGLVDAGDAVSAGDGSEDLFWGSR